MSSVRLQRKAELNTLTPTPANTHINETLTFTPKVNNGEDGSSNNNNNNNTLYRSTQNIVVDKNGKLNVEEIDIGYFGDSNVTKLVFDTSQLDWYQSRLNEYDSMLVFRNDAHYEPLIYAFDGVSFTIPLELTLIMAPWKMVFVLKEVGSGNIEKDENREDELEVFVSSEIATSIPKKSYANDFFKRSYFLTTTKVEDRISLSSLAKKSINVNFDEKTFDLSFQSEEDSFLGYQKDRYVKQLVINKPIEVFGNDLMNTWFAIFKNKQENFCCSECLIDKINSKLITWLPPEVTEIAGDWDIELVGTNMKDMGVIDFEDESAIYYFSNIISGQIKNNFLSSIILEPNRGDTSNLISCDGFCFETSDNYTIYGR